MPQTARQQSSSQPASRRQVCKFELTDRERRDLLRLMHRVLEDVETDKNSYRILMPGDPNCGRLLKDGVDITEQTLLDEMAARRFLFLARLK
jgi:hypothetical protein